jgi:phenylpropionate dioxygenase-like ring-hydroxylating dioxygenase large terminal subunit
MGPHLECAYHGWQFDGLGACRLVPALGRDPERASTAVPAFRTVESQGYVWVFAEPGAEPEQAPFRFPFLDTEGYAAVRMAAEVEAPLHATVENMLDVPHTAFLHRGLFRGGPRRPLTAVVRRYADRVEAEYLGEPRPSGLLARLLAPAGGTVEHVDRFRLPSIAEVEYRLDRSHVCVTNVLTPVTENRTRFVSVVSYRLPLPSLLVHAVLAPIARGILRQDARILRLQTENARRFGGEHHASTEADLLGPHVRRLLHGGRAHEPAHATDPPEFEKRVEIWV